MSNSVPSSSQLNLLFNLESLTERARLQQQQQQVVAAAAAVEAVEEREQAGADADGGE